MSSLSKTQNLSYGYHGFEAAIICFFIQFISPLLSYYFASFKISKVGFVSGSLIPFYQLGAVPALKTVPWLLVFIPVIHAEHEVSSLCMNLWILPCLVSTNRW